MVSTPPGKRGKPSSTQQGELFDEEAQTRSLLDVLLRDSKLYTSSKSYKGLIDFAVKLRNFAPFNAMLLQIQKPGLSFAASAQDWRDRFNRTIKEDARPLLILMPFAPVALVYDVMDTEGDPLPEDVTSFPTKGNFEQSRIPQLAELLNKKNIDLMFVDAGDRSAGYLHLSGFTGKEKIPHYQIKLNQNHEPVVQFATITHELAHLYLGHLGKNSTLKVPDRHRVEPDMQELEAESVAFIVCNREGIEPKSQKYLSWLVNKDSKVDDLDVYQIMRAAGQVEKVLGLATHTKFS